MREGITKDKVGKGAANQMILHVPHSSDYIPKEMRDQFVISDEEICAELRLLTDAYTDELFFLEDASVVKFPISRLLVDVERYPDDADEPMSKVGMGMIYTRTVSGKALKRKLDPHENANLEKIYKQHHQILRERVENELAEYGNVLIVDCHSFPSYPLQCDRNQSTPRPDFCIGTDEYHTPKELVQKALSILKKVGYSVKVNHPYEGTIVPMSFYERDPRVTSIMVEVNRCLYMNEMSGMKTAAFEMVKRNIQTLLRSIRTS